ncbi:hypothetical protein L6452_36901 [Arctium lappa]|uniref:Uncharacterized protein n=1 Tax=Arctium lappa TaxID=4217 RepID=A0ACB8Y1K2_ARCLA|nr:hypothetical protein L6452_36901 [Arctium lappa]
MVVVELDGGVGGLWWKRRSSDGNGGVVVDVTERGGVVVQGGGDGCCWFDPTVDHDDDGGWCGVRGNEGEGRHGFEGKRVWEEPGLLEPGLGDNWASWEPSLGRQRTGLRGERGFAENRASRRTGFCGGNMVSCVITGFGRTGSRGKGVGK